MTDQAILSLALNFGMSFELPPVKLLAFAKEIAKQEREACASVAEGCINTESKSSIRQSLLIAQRIRERELFK